MLDMGLLAIKLRKSSGQTGTGDHVTNGRCDLHSEVKETELMDTRLNHSRFCARPFHTPSPDVRSIRLPIVSVCYTHFTEEKTGSERPKPLVP